MATEQKHGPFDRILHREHDMAGPHVPDRAPIYVGGTIVGLAILLIVLVLPPISILSGDGEGGAEGSSVPAVADGFDSKPRGSMPKLPAGLEAASSMFDLSAPADRRGASGVTVALKEKQTEPRSLSLYTYAEDRWQRLSDVSLVAGGLAARGEVGSLPGNVAVLKKTRATLQIAGAVPAGTELDPRAQTALTTLHPLVFIPAGDGTLVGTPPAVPPAGYQVVPGIVAFAPEVVDDILRTTEVRDRHAAEIAQRVQEGNFAGISIDYRTVNPALREQFTQFVQTLSNMLHEDGRTLSLTLPMPSQREGELDEGAYDWEALGAAVDTIEMAGELDQELYFQATEAALAYVTEKVDRTKLLLTISSLSIERGGDGLRAMPLNEALTLASQIGIKVEGDIVAGSPVPLVAQNVSPAEGASGIAWDDTARAVTFSYPGRGGKRTVWIANAFSAAFRVELAQRYGLGGVVITDTSTQGGGADLWAPIRELADTGTLVLSKPNGDLFAPTWAAEQGALNPTIGDAVTWTAPAEPGSYDITLIVSDGAVRVGQRVTLDVVAAPEAADEAPE